MIEGKEARLYRNKITSIKIGEVDIPIKGNALELTLVTTPFFRIQEELEEEAKKRLGKKKLPIDEVIRCARLAAETSGAQNIKGLIDDFALELNSKDTLQRLSRTK
jgi:hypothetical protein